MTVPVDLRHVFSLRGINANLDT
ncbi:hypothetical protein [Desulfocurvibacter africanus]